MDAAIETRLRELEAQVAHLSAARERPGGLTIIAFSGDMDRLLAAFMLANGAAAMGLPVVMFFTFWALPALKRKTIFKGKRVLEKLVTAMLPAGPHRLGPSRWSLFGLGRVFFEALMRSRHMEDLRNLIAVSQQMNVRIVACGTAMEVMAVTKEELMEGIEFGGVATFFDAALDGTVTLFI